MASQFRNSNLGYYLYSAIVILIGAASLFVFWYMITGYNIGRYAENTIIGSVYIGGLTEEQAERKLRTNIETWLQNDRVLFEVGYQGYYYELDRDLIYFDIERSLDDLNDGRTNPLYVEFSPQARSEILDDLESQPFMETLQDQFNLENVLDDFLADAAGMKTFSSKQLNHYIINEEMLFQELFTRAVPIHPNVSGNLLMGKLNQQFPDGITINAKTTISILELFSPEYGYTQDELAFLGTMFLDMIPHTPFNIFERQYYGFVPLEHYTNDTFPYFGRNVRVNRTRSVDFSFENNTYCNFTVEFELSFDVMTLRFTGAPFLNTIIAHETEYVPIVGADDEDNGEAVEGVVVMIRRSILDINDQFIREEELIVLEYYGAS